jgi:3-dehydroquinate synthase
MSASFDIASSSGNYSVVIESHAFDRFLSEYENPLLIVDKFFEPRFEQAARNAVFMEAIETNKSLDASPALIETIRKSGAGRQTHLVAVGGGILQDTSAFIASIYMRGLEWSYVPTTILSMVDSCIGGKSSINVGRYKNLVGTFHPPVRVLIDPAVAVTLPEDQRASGLIEAAKICFCRGVESFDRYLSLLPRPEMRVEALEQVIAESLMAKKWFIETDEFDKKERLLLNFGHTFGHAIEGALHYSISHGIAVGLGILCALEFERQSGTDYSNISRVSLLEAHLLKLVARAPDLALHLGKLDMHDLMERFESDKKHTREAYTLILVTDSGEVTLKRILRNEDSRERVKRSVKKVMEKYAW